MSSEVIIAAVFIILVFISYRLFDHFMRQPLGRSVDEEVDEIQLSTKPIASVWGYWQGNVYKYRWVAQGFRNEGRDNFNSEKEAVDSAERNGYDIDWITD